MDMCRYVTEYGEYDDSTGLIAVSYNDAKIIKLMVPDIIRAGYT